MIRLSLPRWITVRARVFAALVAVLACAGLACESRVCTAIGCIDGLVIHFNGTLEAGRTYDLVLTEQTPAGESQFMTCTLLMPAAPAGTSELDCSSSVSHQEIGTMLQIRRNDIGNLTVVVSSAGTELGRQTFQPAYATREINGPGCGTCTQASVDVTVP